jgi:hypothetical protein
MSILNLNAPQGRGPAGKKSLKIWMGVGLLAAVLGFGSTFAADILINNNNQSEFGQGVSQTVYCGSENPTKITVRPISKFVNSVDIDRDIDGDGEWRQPTFDSRRFVRVSSLSLAFSKSIKNDETGDLEVTKGYYVTSRDDDGNDGFHVGFRAPSSGPYVDFAPQVVSGDSYGFYKYDNFRPGRFVDTTPSNFRMVGVSIQDIPTECKDVNFVLSAYGETGDALNLISDNVVNVNEVVYKWDGVLIGRGYSVSRDRNSFVGTDLVTSNTNTDSLTFLFLTESGTVLSTNDVKKIVVETQEDALIDW